ncbi:MAG: ribosome maturation factor RimM [Candidatus Binataceae bacterium]
MVSAERPSRRTSAPASNEIGLSAHNESTRGDSAREMIRIGRIAGAHGLNGALRMRPDNPDSNSFAHAESVTLELGDNRREYVLVSAGRAGAGMIRLIVEGVSDVEQAEALKGATVMVETSELPAAAPGEFYYYQAVGCEVVLTDGRKIGIVQEVLSTGANDVLVVRNGRKETLVPVIADVVKEMDMDARRIVIEPVPGLLE